MGLVPGLGRFTWRRKCQPTPAFLPGKSHGQRSLVGYSPWGCKELDMTQWLNNSNKNSMDDGQYIFKKCNIFCWYFQALPMKFVVKLWTSTIITLQGAIYLQYYSGRCLATSSGNYLPPEFLLSPRCITWIYVQVTLWGGLKTFPCEACWADGCKKWFIGYLHSLCTDWTTFS